MDRWGDYWRFTDKSAKLAFSEVFGEENVEVECFGNALVAVAGLEGISANELNENELLYADNDYQFIIAVKATKKGIIK